jgi:hypothetical protein
MSWHFSQAVVAAYSGESSSGGAPSAPSKSTTTTKRSSPRAKRMDALHRSLFGTMSGVSRSGTGRRALPSAHCAAFVIASSSREGSRARISAPPAKAPVSMARGQACGVSSHGSFARWDRTTSSWKTPQCSLLEGLDAFSETWPQWGMMRSGACSVLPTPSGILEIRALITSESVSGSLQRFPTPRANDGEKRGNFDIHNPRNGLPAAIKRVPTPCATDGSKGGPNAVRFAGSLSLPAYVARYRTPCVTDGSKWSKHTAAERKAKGSSVRLPHELGAGGQQSPMWTEWLMGWPIGWTDCTASATARYQQWWHSLTVPSPQSET